MSTKFCIFLHLLITDVLLVFRLIFTFEVLQDPFENSSISADGLILLKNHLIIILSSSSSLLLL